MKLVKEIRFTETRQDRPDRALEYERAEDDATIGKPDDAAENEHDHDVENEL